MVDPVSICKQTLFDFHGEKRQVALSNLSYMRRALDLDRSFIPWTFILNRTVNSYCLGLHYFPSIIIPLGASWYRNVIHPDKLPYEPHIKQWHQIYTFVDEKAESVQSISMKKGNTFTFDWTSQSEAACMWYISIIHNVICTDASLVNYHNYVWKTIVFLCSESLFSTLFFGTLWLKKVFTETDGVQ